MNKFEELYKLNVNDKVEKREGMNYLSWAYAWAEFKKVYPDATYEVLKDPTDGVPYFESSAGAMCYTKVTAGGITHEMWLPVMNSSKKAMKSEPYEYNTKSGKRTVEAFTMFDVNTTVMRCLVKNLAMFGLGLYIYAGEDLPEQEPVDIQPWINQIKEASDIDSLKTIYFASVKACGELFELENAKDQRKTQLTANA